MKQNPCVVVARVGTYVCMIVRVSRVVPSIFVRAIDLGGCVGQMLDALGVSRE